MKIICAQSELAKGVDIVSKAVPTRTSMTLLECILIDASTNEIHLIANDTEIGIETVIEGTIEERGVVAIEAKWFSEMIRKIPDSFVTIETDNTHLTTLTCEKTELKVPGKSGEEFPRIPVLPMTNAIDISQLTLKDVVRQTSFSISNGDNNKMMTGELFDFKDDILKVVALDGNRISIRNIKLDQQVNERKVIVPGKTLKEIAKIIGSSAEEKVRMFLNENHIVFQFNETTVVSRLIEGNYFRIDQMVSSDYDTKVKVNKKSMLESIDRASVMSKEGDKRPIVFNIEGNNMLLSIESVFGSMNDDLEVVKEGKDLIIGFNPKYIMEALRAIDDEEVSLYMVNTKSPCVIRDDADTYAYVILPININVN